MLLYNISTLHHRDAGLFSRVDFRDASLTGLSVPRHVCFSVKPPCNYCYLALQEIGVSSEPHRCLTMARSVFLFRAEMMSATRWVNVNDRILLFAVSILLTMYKTHESQVPEWRFPRNTTAQGNRRWRWRCTRVFFVRWTVMSGVWIFKEPSASGFACRFPFFVAFSSTCVGM